jgi:hypothetical protein
MRIITLAAVAAAIAGPALAAPWIAVPVQPSSKVGFVGDSVVWSCDATGCSSQSDTEGANTLSECLALARQLGPLTSFSDGKPISASRLSECNGAAPKPKG